MKSIATILAIFLVQCAYLRAEPEPIIEEISKSLEPIINKIGKSFRDSSDSCIFGVKSISILMSNSFSIAKNISTEETCQSIGPSKQVAIIIHGFVSSAITMIQKLAKPLIQKNYTVFAIDWSQGACTNGIPIIKYAAYSKAVDNTRPVGKYIGEFVLSLIKECGIQLKNIIFIGHSLGSHVAGFAAKWIYNSTDEKPPLIIAADPASPMFEDNTCDERLCKTDANCVKVVHTSPLGISKHIGHLYMQMNNGGMQPGCGIDPACSHSKSIDYISAMMSNQCGFPGVPTEASSYSNPSTMDCVIMNNILDKTCPKTGVYNVFVEDIPSHCKTFNC